MRLFVDTGGWLSVAVEADRYHPEGTEYFKRVVGAGIALVTTDYILDESITRLAYDHGHSVAIEFLTDINDSVLSGQLEVVTVDSAKWASPETIFRQYPDTKLSFTDCTSFVVMRELGVHGVFGFDTHFPMFGFVLNP